MSNVYESLRQLAHRQRVREPAHTLQTPRWFTKPIWS